MLKRDLDLATPGTWIDLIKDIAALANSGGGVVVVGLDEQGRPTGWDPRDLLRTERSAVVEPLAAYVGERFEGVEIVEAEKGAQRLAVIQVAERTGSPLVFERAGAYLDADGQEREVFARGTTYVRHGAKSEPALARDITRFASREEKRIRRDITRNLRRVSSAPTGSQVLVVPPRSAPSASVERVRLVDDPDAPAVALADFDVTHPYRQTEVIASLNARLGGDLVNSHTILCVRRIHDTDRREEFFHKPRFGSPQYSDAFIDWVVASYSEDAQFFDDAKAEYRRRQLARRAR